MAVEYQGPDERVADYQSYCLDEGIIDRSTREPLWIRGPKPERLEPKGYFVCLGAAQTFGRFCERPFASILQDRLGMPVLNISHGGAGPAFYCGDNARLLEYLNGAKFVVVQVMSGRSDSNSLYESDGVGHFRRRSDGKELGCDEAFGALLANEPRARVAQVVNETRQSWRENYRRLLRGVTAPKILFWFSTRPPRYEQGWDSLSALYGAFPQLVDAGMVRAVRRHCDRYVECVTASGLPQPLIDRFNGLPTEVVDPWTAQPWTENWYYPSPEMHEQAAAALEPVCRPFLTDEAAALHFLHPRRWRPGSRRARAATGDPVLRTR